MTRFTRIGLLLAVLFGPAMLVASPPAAAGATDTVTVSGVVRDGSGHGWPLWSRVTVDGLPAAATHSSPWTGRYRLTLPANATYTVTVQPDAIGYPPVTRQVSVGSTDTEADLTAAVDGDSCQAPGYRHVSDGALADFGTGAPDAGWTVTDPLGNGRVWRFDDPAEHGNLTGGLGRFAILDSEFYRFDREDSAIVSPVVDLTGVAEPTIGFRSDFFVWDYSEPSGIADVDLSLDGGTTWTTVWRADTERRGPEQVVVPIPQAAGKANVRARFRYHEGEITAGVWWQLDSVWVGNRSCDPIPGGLLVGRTRDRNTGEGVAGATVRGPAGAPVTSVATPTDPALDDGFYALFSPTLGTAEFTAASPEYQSQPERVSLAGGAEPVRLDFALAAGRITSSSTAVRADVELGESTTTTLTLRNRGTANATVRLVERPGDAEVLTAAGSRVSAAALDTGPGAPLQRIDGTFSPHAGDRKAPPATTAAATTGAAQGWTGVADYPIAISDNAAAAQDGKVYSVGGQEDHNYGVRNGYVFDPAAGSWSELPPLPRGRQAPTAAFLGGKLHVVGGWSESNWGYDATMVPQVDIYDPATGQWSSGPANPAPVAAAGSTVLDDRLYVVGGCTAAEECETTQAMRYDAATRAWDRIADYPLEISWLNCGAIEELVYCAGGVIDSWPQRDARPETYSYDPRTDAWTRRADLPIELWASSGTVANGRFVLAGGVTNGAQTVTNQSFGYDPLTDTWSSLPNTTYPLYRGAGACGFYRIGGGPPTGLSSPFVELLPGHGDCASYRDSAWLSASGVSGQVMLRPGQEVRVRVRVDAGVVGQPGTYAAKLMVREDTPYPTPEVDVTMAADPPRRWGLVGGTVTGVGCDGTTRPLPGATVSLDGRYDDFTVPTDGDGRYARWLDSRNAPLTLIAGLDGWNPEVRTVRLRAGERTTVDVRLQQADCGG